MIIIHRCQHYIALNFQVLEHLFMEFILSEANLQGHGIIHKQIVHLDNLHLRSRGKKTYHTNTLSIVTKHIT